MADNSPFHAALLRRDFFRHPMWRGEEADGGSGESRRHEVTAPPTPNFALRPRAAPPHELNATTAGQEKHVRWPVRQGLLRRRSPAAPVAAVTKSVRVATAPSRPRLKPATWPAKAEPVKVHPSAPRSKLASAQPFFGLASAPSAEAGPPGELRLSAYALSNGPLARISRSTPTPAVRENLGSSGTASKKLVSLYAPPYARRVSFGADQASDDETMPTERFDGPSAGELAKRYAPRPAAGASRAPEAEAIAGHLEFYWSSRTAATVIALVALLAAVGTLGSLTTPSARRAAAEPIHSSASDDGQTASASLVGRTIGVEEVPTSQRLHPLISLYRRGEESLH